MDLLSFMHERLVKGEGNTAAAFEPLRAPEDGALFPPCDPGELVLRDRVLSSMLLRLGREAKPATIYLLTLGQLREACAAAARASSSVPEPQMLTESTGAVHGALFASAPENEDGLGSGTAPSQMLLFWQSKRDSADCLAVRAPPGSEPAHAALAAGLSRGVLVAESAMRERVDSTNVHRGTVTFVCCTYSGLAALLLREFLAAQRSLAAPPPPPDEKRRCLASCGGADAAFGCAAVARALEESAPHTRAALVSAVLQADRRALLAAGLPGASGCAPEGAVARLLEGEGAIERLVEVCCWASLAEERNVLSLRRAVHAWWVMASNPDLFEEGEEEPLPPKRRSRSKKKRAKARGQRQRAQGAKDGAPGDAGTPPQPPEADSAASEGRARSASEGTGSSASAGSVDEGGSPPAAARKAQGLRGGAPGLQPQTAQRAQTAEERVQRSGEGSEMGEQSSEMGEQSSDMGGEGSNTGGQGSNTGGQGSEMSGEGTEMSGGGTKMAEEGENAAGGGAQGARPRGAAQESAPYIPENPGAPRRRRPRSAKARERSEAADPPRRGEEEDAARSDALLRREVVRPQHPSLPSPALPQDLPRPGEPSPPASPAPAAPLPRQPAAEEPRRICGQSAASQSCSSVASSGSSGSSGSASPATSVSSDDGARFALSSLAGATGGAGLCGGALAAELSRNLSEMADELDAIFLQRRPWIESVVTHISSIASACLPGASVVPFGSFASGLAVPSSDVDLVLCYMANGAWWPAADPLELLSQALASERWVQAVQYLPGARVPVIKMTCGIVPTGADVSAGVIHVDISLDSGAHRGVETAAFVARLCWHLPGLRPLVIVLKALLKERGLNDTYRGGLSSYGLTVMAAAVIKRYELQPPARHPSLGELFLEFMETYASKTFDTRAKGVRIAPEGPLADYNVSKFPEMAKVGTPEYWVPPAPVIIADPIVPGNNVGSSAFGFKQVQYAFDNVLDRLRTYANGDTDAFMSAGGAAFDTAHHNGITQFYRTVWCPREIKAPRA